MFGLGLGLGLGSRVNGSGSGSSEFGLGLPNIVAICPTMQRCTPTCTQHIQGVSRLHHNSYESTFTIERDVATLDIQSDARIDPI